MYLRKFLCGSGIVFCLSWFKAGLCTFTFPQSLFHGCRLWCHFSQFKKEMSLSSVKLIMQISLHMFCLFNSDKILWKCYSGCYAYRLVFIKLDQLTIHILFRRKTGFLCLLLQKSDKNCIIYSWFYKICYEGWRFMVEYDKSAHIYS